MKSINYLILFICCLFLSYGCSKVKFPQPDFILQYQTANGSYDQTAQYRTGKNEDYTLIPATDVSWTNNASSDSTLIQYISSIKDKSGRPVVQIMISKFFDNSKLDFLQNGTPVLKNASDFYNVFASGVVNIKCAKPSDIHDEGIDISLHDSTYYFFQDISQFNLHPPVSAYQDSANAFEITKSTSDIDFSSLAAKNITPSNTTYRALMVTVKFKCKLYDIADPHPTRLLTNCTYQGIFLDR